MNKNNDKNNGSAMNLMESLNWRYAVKQFSSDKISDKTIDHLLSATCLSPSSFGLQPYRILVIRSEAIREQLFAYSMEQQQVLQASHLIVFAVKTDTGDALVDSYAKRVSEVQGVSLEELDDMREQFKNALASKMRREKIEWAKNQAYLALGNLLTCAAIMKVDACPMEGFEPEGYDKILGLGEKQLTSTVVCTLGVRHKDDTFADLPKVRFDRNELIVTV